MSEFQNLIKHKGSKTDFDLGRKRVWPKKGHKNSNKAHIFFPFLFCKGKKNNIGGKGQAQVIKMILKVGEEETP